MGLVTDWLSEQEQNERQIKITCAACGAEMTRDLNFVADVVRQILHISKMNNSNREHKRNNKKILLQNLLQAMQIL